MAAPEPEDDERCAWVWVAGAVGFAVAAVGVVWLLRYRHPVRRLNRLLRRCQERIQGIESSLSHLESQLQSSPS